VNHRSQVLRAHPSNKAGIDGERDDAEGLDGEASLKRFAVVEQQAIDETEKLHDPFILPDVLMTCARIGSGPKMGYHGSYP
jgi:hypothetical protein